uniref:Structural maintenance of chromosomes flexible hinge domain containing 1 n=1 Tax=Scleropages formosus TaxID=113540 RepID=A0A8C9QY59_SCLFO
MADCDQEQDAQRTVFVFDCRWESDDGRERSARAVRIGDLDFPAFLRAVTQEFSIDSEGTFVLTTTDRKEITAERFAELKDGNTLHLLQSVDQVLPTATKERILFLPHYDTLIKSGMYEYYASEGQKSLPYALAELIDNSLSATASNPDVRTIEIRLLFDESQGKPAVVVLDNGCGMTSKQLNNWAVYRLSKFTRENSTFRSDHADYVRPCPVPRSLNSDISYFGVGGKQAVFFIGQSVRMITKPASSPDVHELVLSKEEFERKEKNKEDIYCGFIRNRQPGDSSHISMEEERFLHGFIREELLKEHFTAVVVTGVQQEHIAFLRSDFYTWTRELAHVYHYYIHGAHGNDRKSTYHDPKMTKINIQVCLMERSKLPRMLNLREVTDDMQTLYINSAVDTFEFRAHVGGDGVVEGTIRYHPFLYDRETYPEDPYVITTMPADDDDECVVVSHEGRGKRPVFECYWNGRLIPYTTISEFEWCAWPKKSCPLPVECFSRISGVLFANDHFQVSTNKLTFMDLELQLKDKETIFTRVVNGQEQRVKIQKEFFQWLKDCHEKWDKQVKFMYFQGTTVRTDVVTKKMQSPWAQFTTIEWDGKMYSAGQYVKSIKTHPIFYGSIVQFLLYGDHEGDVYATGGQVQIAMEPRAIFDEVRIIPISKIDRGVSLASIKSYMDCELAKLPHKLNVTWPEGNEWNPDAVRPAGTPFGPIQVEILNKKGEPMMRMPGPNSSASKKLLVELKVVWHSPKGDVETNCHTCQHGGKWPYWFKTMENLSNLGKYTLRLQAVLNENGATEFAGRRLPSQTLHFSICEGAAEKFVVDAVDAPVHVGVPFSITLQFRDRYDHITQPPSVLQPRLECSAFDISYDETVVSGTSFTIKGIRAKGLLKHYPGKAYSVKVVIPGLKQETQMLKKSVFPGPPHSLVVKPDVEETVVENGTSAKFDVKVHDEAGNVAIQPKLIVRCQFQGAPDLPMDAVDCSNTGTGLFTDKPLWLKNLRADQVVTAKFDIPSCTAVAPVERKIRVTPSGRVARLEVFSQQEDGIIALKDGEKIGWTAGDILQNLYYRVFDEADRPVPITTALGKKIKVNWKASSKELEKGKLPDVPVPTVVKDEHYYSVTYQDGNVSVACSFTIMPHPDEPKRMKATWKSITSVQMSEELPGDILLDIVDQYGNKTQTLTSACVNSLGVSADGLDKSALKISWEECTQSIIIRGVRFLPGEPGPRELCLAWREFVECLRINVSPGPPKKVQLVDAPEEPLQVFNGRDLEKPLVVQLCDEWGNPSPDPKATISLKPSTPDLKIKLSAASQSVDAEGKASFIVKQVTAANGDYGLEFKGTLNRQPIPGPVVKVKVLPDPNKPIKLAVSYDSEAVHPAGGVLTVFSVTVVSEEGSNIRNLNPASMSMMLWKGEGSGNKPPGGAETLKCSKPKETERDDTFYFRDKIIPEHVGNYKIQFFFCLDKTKGLWSDQFVINVVPNVPEKLMPDSQPPTPVVSNILSVESRTLFKSLTLVIMDKYKNPAGTHLDGTVVVSIRGSSEEDVELPVFEGNAKTVSFALSGGKAEVTNLTIMENCPGTDGMEYSLHFQPVVPEDNNPLKPFELPFMFYNDSKNQEQMAVLTKKKDRLSQSIMAYKSVFDTNKQLISELKDQLQNASSKELYLKSEIRKSNMNVAQLSTVDAIDALIVQKKTEQENILKQPRRTCSIPVLSHVFRTNPDVLGKVAHLALVEDNDAAQVISWHLSGDMDCVVTRNTAAARQIYDYTQGRQQVMPLDSVLWRNNRPLPHIKGPSSFPAIGNPVFARDLLIFPHHVESCHTVFGNLLGDTILIDNLDAANHYRKAVIQNKVQCPTLLTRQGERVRSNGKFGGLQNKAPPIEKLRGQVFGAPLPKQYHTLRSQIDHLQQYRLAVSERMKVQKDYDVHQAKMHSPEMLQNEKEMMEQEKQLMEIEKKLGTPQNNRMSSDSGMKRSAPVPPSEITPKRPRREMRSLM